MITITDTQIGVWIRNTEMIQRWYDKNESKLSEGEKITLLDLLQRLYKFGTDIKQRETSDPNFSEDNFILENKINE